MVAVSQDIINLVLAALIALGVGVVVALAGLKFILKRAKLL